MPPTPPALLATLNRGGLVPFVGAGISMARPTSLPSADSLAHALVEDGYGQEGDDLEQLAEWCWEQGDPLMFARALPSADWRARQPNDCHLVLAELAAERLVTEILTTNWDTMLEVALNRSGVPHQCVEKPNALAAAGGSIAARVIKLHGCIDSPETIRARRSDVDSEEWVADWAESVFAVNLRSKSVLFAGYSGASRATTRTIERISAEASRSQLDWMVGLTPLEEAVTHERTARLVAALGADQGGYVNMDALEFFRQLRQEIYPLLLARPRQRATSLLEALLAPTKVPAEAVMSRMQLVSDSWTEAGQGAGQEAMRQAAATFARPYVPVVSAAEWIGEYWAWIAVVTWASAADLSASALHAETKGAGAASIEIVPVFCEVGGSRREAAAATLAALATKGSSPSVSYVGIVFGGKGPFRRPPAPFSVVRGTSAPDIIRGGEVIIEWASPDEFFNLVEQEAPAESIAEAIRSRMSELVAATEPAA